MKINVKKTAAAFLCVSLICVTLASCGVKTPTVMSYKDSRISSNMYSFWLSSYKYQFLGYYNDAVESDEFWDTEVSAGVTAEKYAADLINKNIKYILVGMQLFREYGLKISQETNEKITADINEKIDYYGGRSSLNAALSAYNINVDILKDIYIAEEKLYAVYDYLYGENGIEKVTDDKIEKYYEENYSLIKYLIIYTKEKNMLDAEGKLKYDSNGYIMTEPLSDGEKVEKEEKIKNAMLDVNAGEAFDGIMQKYNEENMSSHPEGFFVSANELGIYGFALVNEVKNMKAGEVRRVDDDIATYIVQKCELPSRDNLTSGLGDQLTDLETYCIQQIYEAKFSAYAADIVINEDEFSKFSIRTAAQNSTF